MGLHKPFDRHFFVLGGSVRTSGGSLDLAEGQFGIFNVDRINRTGAAAVADFGGLPKTTKFEMKVGRTDVPIGRSQTNKSMSTHPFTLKDVVELRVSAPKITTPKVDELIIGYNGIEPLTALKFEVGDRQKVVLRLSGEPVGLLGYEGNYVDVVAYLDAEACHNTPCAECDPCVGVNCLPIVQRAIEVLKETPLRGGVLVKDLVDITPVHECNGEVPAQTVDYTHYTLTKCDLGDGNALALVRQQYDDLKIERVARNGSQSVYETLVVTSAGAPTAYATQIAGIMKGCEDCPAGYTEQIGGELYVVSLEDEGVDLSATVEALVNAVAGSAIKQGQDFGVGMYTVLLSAKLSDANLATFLTANPTAVVEYISTVAAFCEGASGAPIAWVAGEVCEATSQEYTLDLPDGDCGASRLAELQAAYPALRVTQVPVIAGGCQHRYSTTVPTNLVCDECSPIFRDAFVSQAPAPYENHVWKAVAGAEPTDCLCGIRVKGKLVEFLPDNCLFDQIGFMKSSTRIQASGGFVTEVRMGDDLVDEPFNVEYLSYAQDLTHFGADMKQWEDRSYTFFTGTKRPDSDVVKALKGAESTIDPYAQYIDYAVVIKKAPFYSQSFSGQEVETTTFHVVAEVGLHQGVEDLLNKLAGAAGVAGVQAFGAIDAPVVPPIGG